jgi:hypothetical protein
MRRRFPAVLASFFLATVLAPIGMGVISDGPSVIASKSTSITNAGRRWN